VFNTNLCLARKDARFIALDTCDRNEPRQRWLGFRPGIVQALARSPLLLGRL
jgi:hypothetical protein